jgi:hypothetical protein
MEIHAKAGRGSRPVTGNRKLATSDLSTFSSGDFPRSSMLFFPLGSSLFQQQEHN